MHINYNATCLFEGNNPHMQLDSLEADSSKDSDVDLLDEEEDSLPTITSKKDRKRCSHFFTTKLIRINSLQSKP